VKLLHTISVTFPNEGFVFSLPIEPAIVTRSPNEETELNSGVFLETETDWRILLESEVVSRVFRKSAGDCSAPVLDSSPSKETVRVCTDYQQSGVSTHFKQRAAFSGYCCLQIIFLFMKHKLSDYMNVIFKNILSLQLACFANAVNVAKQLQGILYCDIKCFMKHK